MVTATTPPQAAHPATAAAIAEAPAKPPMKSIEPLHLILPLIMTPVLSWDPDERPQEPRADALRPTPPMLSGYARLQLLREQTAEFRRNYLNWRKLQPRGAKGEAHDVVTGKSRPVSTVISASVSAAATPLMSNVGRSTVTTSCAGPAAFLRPPVNFFATAVPSPYLSGLPSYTSTRDFEVRDAVISRAIPRSVSTSSNGTAGNFDLETSDPYTCDSSRDLLIPSSVVINAPAEERKWLRFYFNPFVPNKEETAVPLSTSTLPVFQNRSGHIDLTIPTYDRDPRSVDKWIMHLGVGGFHRAHQLVYLDELLNERYGTQTSTTLDPKKDGSANFVHDTVPHNRQQVPANNSHNDRSISGCRRPGKRRLHASSNNYNQQYISPNEFRGEDMESLGNGPKKKDEKWGYCGVGLLECDALMKDALETQDFLFTVLERSNSISAARIVGSMFDYVYAPKQGKKAWERLVDPNLCIVSMTVTEKGYCQAVNGDLDLQNTHVQADLKFLRSISRRNDPCCNGGDALASTPKYNSSTPRHLSQAYTSATQECSDGLSGKGSDWSMTVICESPLRDEQHLEVGPQLVHTTEQSEPADAPKTAIGFICWGLSERRRLGIAPFTVLSCDNLPENGHVAKRMVVAFAAEADPALASWIEKEVAFPCSMVDRITPVTAPEHRDILVRDFGLTDRWPVVTESFRQWVIEDNFPLGRPPWETVGALMCANVRPFELMKLRLLNGGHSMLCYAAYLCGHSFIDDAIADILLSSFLRAYMDEVTPTVHNVTVELERYKEKIVERFGNRMIKDSLMRICEDGSNKLVSTQREALLELVSSGRHCHHAALGLAGFMAFLATAPTELIRDAKKDKLISMAQTAYAEPQTVKHSRNFVAAVYGDAVADQSIYVRQVSLALIAVRTYSMHHVLAKGGTLPALFSANFESAEGFSHLVDWVMSNRL